MRVLDACHAAFRGVSRRLHAFRRHWRESIHESFVDRRRINREAPAEFAGSAEQAERRFSACDDFNVRLRISRRAPDADLRVPGAVCALGVHFDAVATIVLITSIVLIRDGCSAPWRADRRSLGLPVQWNQRERARSDRAQGRDSFRRLGMPKHRPHAPRRKQSTSRPAPG